jgi:hypothetical protein
MQQPRQIKVAAFNAPKAEITSADFRCDGINDDVEINEAVRLTKGENSLITANYGAKNWFRDASVYLAQRYSQFEERMENTFKFVTLAKEHGSVYSFEFSGILRETCNAFIYVLNIFVRNTISKPKKHYDFRDLLVFISHNINDISRRVVVVNNLFPMILMPFSALGNTESQPKWWFAYRKVRRAEVSDCEQANQSNALGALAALAILGNQMGCFIRTKLFVNIAMTYPPDDPAINSERILFDMT